MESFENHSAFSQTEALIKDFEERGYEATSPLDGMIELVVPGMHMIQCAVRDGEIVIDYIESDSSTGGSARAVVGVLKELSEERGLDIRASGVLPEAVDFWETNGFEPDGTDYIYEHSV